MGKFFGNKTKIILGIILALFISFFLAVILQPKENKDIPVLPLTLKVDLNQNADNTLTMNSIGIEENYPQDYQAGFDSNFYVIKIKKGNKVLFTGKTVKSYVAIKENFSKDHIEGEANEKPLENFTLNLPYYKDATDLIITDDSGNESLHKDLTKEHLVTPQKIKDSCGDGVCSDNENILMCATDCSSGIKTFWNK